jgi:hypothetical protein
MWKIELDCDAQVSSNGNELVYARAFLQAIQCCPLESSLWVDTSRLATNALPNEAR